MTGGFEERIRALTQPIDGQLPRPWMTAMRNSPEGEAFIVGRNQRNCYPAKGISHEGHTGGLFNRSGESCRGLCDENTRGGPSPDPAEHRRSHGPPQSAGRLQHPGNQPGNQPGNERSLLLHPHEARTCEIGQTSPVQERERRYSDICCRKSPPPVPIAHGAGTVGQLSSTLKTNRLQDPRSAVDICDAQTERHLVIPTPSLAPPALNAWSRWRDGHLDGVAVRVRDKLAS